ERIRFSTASQAIHCVPPTTGKPFTVVANSHTMKLPFSAQRYEEVEPCPFLPSLLQSPISHSSSRKWWALVGAGGGAISGRPWKYHSPSFLTATAVNRAGVGGPSSLVTSVRPSSVATSGVSCLNEVTVISSLGFLRWEKTSL